MKARNAPMNPENTNPHEPRVGQPARLGPAQPGKARPAKGRAKNKNMTPIKWLITAASVAGTVGGWGLLAHHDAVLADQGTAGQAALVAEVLPEAEPTATILPALTATATAQPT